MIWRVDHHVSTSVGQTRAFYGDGTYLLLKRPEYITVYRQENRQAVFLGYYGQIELPASFPAITFPPGVDQIAVTPSETL